jgi:hypothetical protein
MILAYIKKRIKKLIRENNKSALSKSAFVGEVGNDLLFLGLGCPTCLDFLNRVRLEHVEKNHAQNCNRSGATDGCDNHYNWRSCFVQPVDDTDAQQRDNYRCTNLGN